MKTTKTSSAKEARYFTRILRSYAQCGFPVTRDAVRKLLFPGDEWCSSFGTFQQFKLVAKVK